MNLIFNWVLFWSGGERTSRVWSALTVRVRVPCLVEGGGHDADGGLCLYMNID